MKHLRLALLPLALLIAGCASEGDSTKTADAPPTEAASAEPKPQTASQTPQPSKVLSVDLADLEGSWDRDDGSRYLFVADRGHLIGYRVGDQDYGCRVSLSLKGRRLGGTATFTRAADEKGRLVTGWDLRVEDPDVLHGSVGAWDLDPDTGETLEEVREEHTYVRAERFDEETAAHCRAVARVHLLLDEAVNADDDGAAVMALAQTPLVREMESNPLRESVGDRVKTIFRAILARRTPTNVEAGAPAPADEEAEEAKEAPADFSAAWKEKPLSGIGDLELGEAHGWEGEHNEALSSWTFERYTPGPDGFNEANRFYLDVLDGDLPTTAEAYGERLAADDNFQDYGSRYSKIERSQDLYDGFLIEGTVLDTSDETTEPGFVFVIKLKTTGTLKLRARSGTFKSARVRDEAIALCRALVPVLRSAAKAANEPVAHSEGHATEMQAFLAEFKGKAAGVEAALARFGVAGLDKKEMHYYDLSEPKVVAHEGDRFTFEVKSGMMIRTFGVSWKNGKIVGVEDKGMR